MAPATVSKIRPDDSRTKFQAIGLHNAAKIGLLDNLDADTREAVNVVSHVLPFRTNKYVTENLIDWSRVPDDPIFRLVFPQRQMLEDRDFAEVRDLLKRDVPKAGLAETVNRIRFGLNPHPAGQLTHNVPLLDGKPVEGLQHKYRETVLFFPSAGQTCHAYCTYCFRWAQFVGMEDLKFEAKDPDGLVQYLKAHPEVTDVLFTGGDPMVMRTRVLRRFIEPLLSPDLEHVKNIRIGTKAVSYWPQRFVSDEDADDLMRLFEEVVASGRQLAIMGHYSHPVELAPEIAREAIKRIRSTGAQIRMQAPLIRHVNDNAGSWAELWRTGVNLGLVPYYMFVERDTGARNYFEVPLIRAYDIFREAYGSVSGLARTVRGPSMSTFFGKVRIHGILRMHELMDPATLRMLHDNFSYSAYDPTTPLMLCDFIQARDPAWVKRPFVAEFDEDASWLSDLRPAFGRNRFYFQENAADEDYSQLSLTELLLE